MNFLEKKIINFLLSKHPTYMLILHIDETPTLEILSLTEDSKFKGHAWDNATINKDIDFNTPNTFLEIKHFYDSFKHISYKGLLKYAFYEWTQLYKIGLFYKRMQYGHKKKNLQLVKRMELLDKILERQTKASDPFKPFTIDDIMNYVYNELWYSHPNRKNLYSQMLLYLNSFCNSGELYCESYKKYKIQSKAIAILEEHEIKTEIEKKEYCIQKKIMCLTAILAFCGFIQSGIIKFEDPLLSINIKFYKDFYSLQMRLFVDWFAKMFLS